MENSVVIYGHADAQTTARYFHRAARHGGSPGAEYVTEPRRIPALGRDDIFLFIDPTEDWPLGVEAWPCLKAAYLIDVHMNFESRNLFATWFDVIFVAQKDYVERLKNRGHRNVHWLPLAGDPAVHHVPGLTRDLEVGFVGKLWRRDSRRHRLLTEVLPRFRTNDYLERSSPEEMGRIYSRSRIVLNASVKGDLNMRVFEALMAGALLVTDRIGNGLADLFVEGTHYVGYDSPDEAVEKILYYLSHDEERQAIADQGHRLAMAKHSYDNRWAEIMSVLSGSHDQRAAMTGARSRRALRDLYTDVFLVMGRPRRLVNVACRYGPSARIAFHLFDATRTALRRRLFHRTN